MKTPILKNNDDMLPVWIWEIIIVIGWACAFVLMCMFFWGLSMAAQLFIDLIQTI